MKALNSQYSEGSFRRRKIQGHYALTGIKYASSFHSCGCDSDEESDEEMPDVLDFSSDIQPTIFQVSTSATFQSATSTHSITIPQPATLTHLITTISPPVISTHSITTYQLATLTPSITNSATTNNKTTNK